MDRWIALLVKGLACSLTWLIFLVLNDIPPLFSPSLCPSSEHKVAHLKSILDSFVEWENKQDNGYDSSSSNGSGHVLHSSHHGRMSKVSEGGKRGMLYKDAQL